MNRLTNAVDRVTNGWNMKQLLAILLLLIGVPAWAQAPTVAPSLRYFEGPSIGDRWEGAGLFQFGAGFNAQTGTTYTVLASDMGKFLTFSNGSAVAVTLPQAGTAGFESNKCFGIADLGVGTATVTPTTSTINGAATRAYATAVGGVICSNGTNYLAY
jgi:hypothetical protein